jgi:hypothetical protein
MTTLPPHRIVTGLLAGLAAAATVAAWFFVADLAASAPTTRQ